MIKSDNSGKV